MLRLVKKKNRAIKLFFFVLLTFPYMICLVFCGCFCIASQRGKEQLFLKGKNAQYWDRTMVLHCNQRGKGILRMPGFVEYLLCARHFTKSLTCIVSLNSQKSHFTLRPCERHSIVLVIRWKNRKTLRQYPKLSEWEKIKNQKTKNNDDYYWS